MRSKTPFLLAFLLLIALVGAAIPVAHFVPHVSSQSSNTGFLLSNLVTFNPYGQFSVNETIHGTSNSTALNSVTFGFPAIFDGHVVQMSSQATSGSSTLQTSTSTNVSNNTLFVTVSVQPALSGGANSSLTLGFYVLNTLQAVNGSGYFKAPILISPSVNVPLTQLSTTVITPYITSYIANQTGMQSIGFSQTISPDNTKQTWNYTTTNSSSSVRSTMIRYYSDPSSSGSLSFQLVGRQLTVNPSGQVLVVDTIKIHNRGLNTITTLPYAPLTNSTTLTELPAPGPLLSNSGTVTLSGGDLTLPESIQPNSTVSLIFQYPLGQQYWHFSNGAYDVSVPTTAPIPAVIDELRIYSTTGSGVSIVGNQLSLTGRNTTEIGGNAVVTFKVGAASAFGYTLPIASILFVAVLAAGVLFRPRAEAAESIGSTFESLIKAIEDKISSTNDILAELKSKGTNISRNDLVVGRTRLDDVRSKTSSRIGMLRSQLSSPTAAVQSGLNELVTSDREFDRIVREMLNTYDQLVSKRMKEETFTRVQQGNERRLQGVTNGLLDKVHDVREEYESET